MKNCCKHSSRSKKCIRDKDKKVFNLPRKFTKKICLTKPIKGFSKKSSCAPYLHCKKIKGGSKNNNPKAVAVLINNKDNVEGVIYFKQQAGGVKISYDIKNLKDGKHGFHIHEYGDLTDECKSACSHFNPDNTNHGGLNTKERHAGDLGNIISKKNISKGSLFAKKLTLSPGKYCITGRMIIVHEDEDDLGKGGDEESLKTGNAGKRLTCGVIGLAPP
jgi:Cu-Zn family superoxide dismutase